MQLNVDTVPAEMFTWCRGTKTGVAEVSDLRVGRTEVQFKQLYSDAADEGFAVLNPATGARTRWAVVRVERTKDADNELLAWVLTPTRETLHRQRWLAGWELHILND